MRLEYLQYLVEIDHCHSISKAAQKLYIGQTTLRSILKDLEQELGISIFQRFRNVVSTTVEGEEVLSLAREILSRYEDIQSLSQSAVYRIRPIHIISSPSINYALALPLSKRFHAIGNPNGNLVFHEVSGGEVGNCLIQNEPNIGLTYFLPSVRREYESSASKYQIVVRPVFHDHLYLLAPTEHPLAAQDTITLDEVHNVDLALLSYFATNETSLVYTKDLLVGNRCTTFSSIFLIRRAITELGMLGFLPGYTIAYGHGMDTSKIKPILLTGTREINKIDLCLLHRNNWQLHFGEINAIKCIESYFQELAIPSFPS